MAKYILNLKNDYYSHLTKLSVRSRKTITDLGGTEAMILYYKQHTSFEALPQVGNHTNMQLCSFSNNLIHKQETIKTTSVTPGLNDEQNENEQDAVNYSDLFRSYALSKQKLSVRAVNFLNDLELEYGYADNEENKRSYIKATIIDIYDYAQKRKAGKKTVQDLDNMRNEIRKRIPVIPMDDIPEVKLEHRMQEFFKFEIPAEEIKQFSGTDDHLFYRLVPVYILNLDLPQRQKDLLQYYYFNEPGTDLDGIAEKLHCTGARVRQLIVHFENDVIPGALGNIIENFKEVLSPDFSPDENYREFDCLPPVVYLKKVYYPNNLFSRAVYSGLFKGRLIEIEKIIFPGKRKRKRKSFTGSRKNIYLSLSFIRKTQLKTLIDWLDDQVYRFEKEESNYQFENLIDRFYTEHKISIGRKSRNDLYNIIKEVKRTDWSGIINVTLFSRKKKNNKEIINLIYDFIKAKGKAQKTTVLLSYLKSNFLIIPRINFLLLLNRKKSLFEFVGYGNWNIKNTEVAQNQGGSLRQMIFSKLNASTAPLHISELLHYISRLREINTNSLIANLMLDKSRKFKFFRCGYIGLDKKKYDQSWFELPRIATIKLRLEYLKKKNLITIDQIADYLYDHYRYPKIHIKYLLRDKVSL